MLFRSDALKNRRCFATTGLRPDLRFWVSGAFMGQETTVNNSPEAKVSVQCREAIQTIEIIRDGQSVFTVSPDEHEVQCTFVDKECLPGRHWYYLHVVFIGVQEILPWNQQPAYGIHAWSSPVWVEVK